jgi:hypothetical protein
MASEEYIVVKLDTVFAGSNNARGVARVGLPVKSHILTESHFNLYT